MIILTQNDIDSVKINMHFYRPNKRLESWEICHDEFLKARNSQVVDKRLLALHLMGFLGSWGMYCRRAPLFLNHHYLVHENIIDTLMDKKYESLFDVNSNADLRKNIDLMCDAYNEISNYYQALGVSRIITLASKVMLAVYGCVPAFDSKVDLALEKLQCTNSTVFERKLELLTNYISSNVLLDDFIHSELSKHPDYTYMRILDDFLWNY